jgi:hypothetical protein
MADRVKITLGVAAFLVVATLPVWNRIFAAGTAAAPDLEVPDLPPGEFRCIEPTEYMAANHMELLNRWRNDLVREGITTYTSSTGEVWDISLTGTCLSCHTSKENFCTRCHDYADVEPTCWDCHVGPGGS